MIQSAEEFYKLRMSANSNEQYRATHEEATLETWLQVIEIYPELKQWVAHNKTVPTEILEILSKDSDEKVRFSVALKRKISAEIQLELCKDADSSVRNAIVRNAKVKKEILQILSEDAEKQLKEHAIKRLKLKDF